MNNRTIQTVTGLVAAESCGMVLSHEHLFIDLRNQTAPGASEKPVTAADRPALMQDPYAMRDNLSVDDFAGAVSECAELKRFGSTSEWQMTMREGATPFCTKISVASSPLVHQG